MCDDYDTDYDSEHEEFDRTNLIDDIQRINLALGADSDNSEEEEEEEDEDEEASFSRFSHFKSSNLTPLSASNAPDKTDSVYEPPTIITIRNQDESTPIYAELQTRNTENSQPSTSQISDIYGNKSQSVQEETPSAWMVEHELYNFANVQQDFGEASQEQVGFPNTVNSFSRLEREVLQQGLARNREYQRQLIREISILDTYLTDNKRKQFDLAQVTYNHNEDDASEWKNLPSLYLFSNPYFKDSKGVGPPDNEDAKHYRNLMTVSAYEKKPIAWNPRERLHLAEGVRMQNLKIKLAPLLTRLKGLESQRNVDHIEVKSLKQEINKVKETPEHLLEENLEGIDWYKISNEYCTRRSSTECKLEWCHFGHPRVNRKPWTKQEDKMILSLTKGKDHVNWNLAAQTLQTNRTPIECFKRYQRSLNKDLVKSKWTPEEDKQLVELVKMFGMRNWQRIADFMEGRVGEQCMHRYMKACIPEKKGKWSDDESQKLKEAVEKCGSNWEKVAEYVPGRTGTQCRERYVNVVDPTLNKGAWTAEEDEKLLVLIEKYGEGNWAKIAKELVPRTDNQCWRRWSVVRKKEAIDYRLNTVRKRREEMVLNFVGRRKERPSITPNDLDIQDVPVIIPKRDPRPRKKRTPRAKKTSDNTDKPAKTPKVKKPRVKKRTKENVPGSDHTYAAPVVKTEKNPGNEQRTLKPKPTNQEDANADSLNDQEEVAEEEDEVAAVVLSSDDDWDDTTVSIDISKLGTRASARKRKENLSYVEKDDLTDVPVDIPVEDIPDDDNNVGDDLPQVPVEEESTTNLSTTTSEGNQKQKQKTNQNANSKKRKTVGEKKKTSVKRRTRKINKQTVVKDIIIPLQETVDDSFLFLSVPSFTSKSKSKQTQAKTKATSKMSGESITTPNTPTRTPTTTSTITTPNNTNLTTSTSVMPVQAATASTISSSTPTNPIRTNRVVIAPRFTPIAPIRTTLTNSINIENNSVSSCTPNTSTPNIVTANTRPVTRTGTAAGIQVSSLSTPNTREQSVAMQLRKTTKTGKERKRRSNKVKRIIPNQNVTIRPGQQQVNVAPFSLLLQAFNINVAAVLQQLNPGGAPLPAASTTAVNTTSRNTVVPTSTVSVVPISSGSLQTTPHKTPTSQQGNNKGLGHQPNATIIATSPGSAQLASKDTVMSSTQPLCGPGLPQSITTGRPTISTIHISRGKDPQSAPASIPPSSKPSQNDETSVSTSQVIPRSTTSASSSLKDPNAQTISEALLPSSAVSQSGKGTEMPTATIVSTSQVEGDRNAITTQATDKCNVQKGAETSKSFTSEIITTQGTDTSELPNVIGSQANTSLVSVSTTQKRREVLPKSTPQSSLQVPVQAKTPSSASSISFSSLRQKDTESSISSSSRSTAQTVAEPTEDISNEFKSPSRRKSTKPRKITSESEEDSSKLDNTTTSTKTPAQTCPSTTSVSKPKEIRSSNAPSIPPLPPTLTTLKGLRNLLAMKEQLQRLAAQTAPAPSQAKQKKVSSNENTVNQGGPSQAKQKKVSSNENTVNQGWIHSMFSSSSTSSTSTDKDIIPGRTPTTRTNSRNSRVVSSASISRSTNSQGTTKSSLPSSTSVRQNSSPGPSQDFDNAGREEELVVVHIDGLRTHSNCLPTNSSSDIDQTGNNNELVVVHINTNPTKSKPQSRNNPTKSKPRSRDNPTKIPRRSPRSQGRKKKESRIETVRPNEEPKTDKVNAKESESSSTALGQATPPPVNRSNIDPFVKFALYRKTPEYKLLSARFHSLFLWPMLMSEVAVSGRLCPTLRNQLAHVIQSPGPTLLYKPSEPPQKGRTESTVTPNAVTHISNNSSANETTNSVSNKKANKRPSKQAKKSTKARKETKKRRKVVDDDDGGGGGGGNINDGDDDYVPQVAIEPINQIASSRTLRSRKRSNQSLSQTDRDSNNAGALQTTESSGKDDVPAKKSCNSAVASSDEPIKILVFSTEKPAEKITNDSRAAPSPVEFYLSNSANQSGSTTNQSCSKSAQSSDSTIFEKEGTQEPRNSTSPTLNRSNVVKEIS